MNVFKRYNDPDATYYARYNGPDPDKPGASKRFLRNTFETTKEGAEKVLKSMVKAAAAGRFDVLEATKARHQPDITIGQLWPHYVAGARELDEQTRRGNLSSLRILVRHATGAAADADVDNVALKSLTGDLVYKYRQTVLDAAAAETADDIRTQQLCRSANSFLRQARSIFSVDMRTYYKRVAGLKLPDSILGFCAEPAFKKVKKSDYNKPDDQIIARTFADLPALERDDLNAYLAIWTALGFGLRKSEIAAAKVGWFIRRAGVLYARADVLGKNGQIPDIMGQLGVSDKLAAHLVDRDPSEHLLQGHDTERGELVFDRVGEWMEARGWKTQKRIHEFRAYAICQLAEQTGDLIEAQKWARHSSYVTTEQAYGRYIRSKGLAVKLTVPEAEFLPKVV